MAFGVTSTGFQIKRLPDIVSSLQTRAKSAFGNNINLSDDSILGQLITIMATEIADSWEGAQGVYNAAYPNTSNGTNLDNVSDLVGITRLPAKKTTVTLALTGTPFTVVAQGFLAEQVGSGKQFVTTSAVTLNPTDFNKVKFYVQTVANSSSYSVTIGGTTRSFTSDASATGTEIAAGLVAAINTPSFGVTAVDNLNATFNLSLAGNEERTLTFDSRLQVLNITRVVSAIAADFGPITANPGTIRTILTPVFGINDVTNNLKGTTGRNEETDVELRKRRYESVQVAGVSTVDAIRSKIRQVDGVTNAIVIENNTLVTDGGGRPGKSFQCIVEGGDSQDIGEVIWASKPAGIESFGAISVNVLDTEGATQVVKFSRPTAVYIHFNITYSLYSEESFPADGVNAIKKAVVDAGNLLLIGNNVITQRFFGPVFTNVSGIGVLTIQIAKSADGITPGPYSTNNIAIAPTEVPLFDVSRVSVTLV